MRTIFENKDICITDLEKNYDFIALIENKTNKTLHVDFMSKDMVDCEDTIIIKPNDWVGILADETGYNQLEKLNKGQYYINI